LVTELRIAAGAAPPRRAGSGVYTDTGENDGAGAGTAPEADAATIARLEQLELADARANQAEQDRHHAEAHTDRAEERADGADLVWEAENKRADEAEKARDLLQAAFDRSRWEMQTELEPLRTAAQAAEARAAALEQAETERAARSRWQRLWQALRR
jgi:hypothetical protein